MEEKTCYWDHHRQVLVGNTKSKVLKFLRDKLIVPADDGFIEVDPLPGNAQMHTVNPVLCTCTCQAYHMRGGRCSHIHAVLIWLEGVRNGGRIYEEGINRRKAEAKT